MKEHPLILRRDIDISEEERLAMEHFFDTTNSRLDVRANDLVIGRYSVLPFYEEQERDIQRAAARLINTKDQHDYAADMGRWVKDFEGWTPKTWGPGEYGFLPDDKSFVLKGATNSKKFLWDTHMFAPRREDVQDVLRRLLDDSLITHQPIYIREYIPLQTFCYGLHGLPITKEMRFFVCNRKILSGGFYWASHSAQLADEGVKIPTVGEVPPLLLEHIVATVGDKIPFYAFDVAQTVNGQWILIEINDGQMAGLSENPPYLLYRKLFEVVANRPDSQG